MGKKEKRRRTRVTQEGRIIGRLLKRYNEENDKIVWSEREGRRNKRYKLEEDEYEEDEEER